MSNDSLPISLDTEFSRVGQRDYIQGVEILKLMLQSTLDACKTARRQVPKQILVSRVKYVRRTLCNGHITGELGAGIDWEPPAQAACHLVGRIGELDLSLAFLPDASRPVTRSEPSPILPFSGFEPIAQFGANFTLDTADGSAFLNCLIETNKRAIQHGIGEDARDARVELVEASNILYQLEGMVRPGPVTLRNISTYKLQSRMYILNEALYFDSLGQECRLRLHYSVHRE